MTSPSMPSLLELLPSLLLLLPRRASPPPKGPTTSLPRAAPRTSILPSIRSLVVIDQQDTTAPLSITPSNKKINLHQTFMAHKSTTPIFLDDALAYGLGSI